MQRFLEANPRFLVQHLGEGRGQWVIPKRRLGAEYETDFLIAELDATGYVWYAVELERPQAKLFTAAGDPTKELTHAIRQIIDWRIWISRNRDYATRPVRDSGLGLIDIDPDLEGLIIMGRDADIDPATHELRRKICQTNRLKIHTYDWLLQVAEERWKVESKTNPYFLLGDLLARREESLPNLAVYRAFDGISSGTVDISATRSEDWEWVSIKMPEGRTVDIAYKAVVQYGERSEMLGKFDWDDWTEAVARIGDEYSLLVSERPISRELTEKLEKKSEGIWVESVDVYSSSRFRIYPSPQLHVLVYLEKGIDKAQAIERLLKAKAIIRDWVIGKDMHLS